MSIANKAYSRRQLITVAEVASALAKGRDRTGLEAVMELAQAVQDGNLTADLYPPHQRWVNDGKADRIGVPASNPTEIWRILSKKSSERGISDKDDFNYPPAASTWHLLADDVFAFANSGALSNSAAAALRELAVRYKAEAATDAEFLRAWGIHEQVDRCKADIQRWERLEQNAPTPSEAIAAEGKLAGLRAELAGLLSQLSGAAQEHPQATVSQPQAAPDTTPASAEQVESDQRPAEQSEVGVAHHAEPIPASAPAIATNVEPPIADELVEQPVQASPDWCVRKPKRGGGYRESLYRFLLAAWNAGKPRPTARDFLEACRVNQSIEIAKVLPDSIDYYDGNGDTKPANLEAIRKAIERMAVGR